MEVSAYRDFAALPGECERLFTVAAGKNPFLSRAWFEHLAARALDPGDVLHILVASTDEGVPVCMLPLLWPASPARWRSVSQLRALQNFYSPEFRPLMLAGNQGVAGLAAICDWLAVGKPSVDVLDLGPMPREQAVFEVTREALSAAGFATRSYFRFGNHYLPLAGRDFAAYRDSLPSRVRHTLERKGRRLARERQVDYRLVTAAADVPGAAADYESVYRESWKRVEPYPGFIPGLMELAAREGWLRLGLLYIDGEPAAAHFWLVSGTTAYIYKLGHRECYREYSPGTLLMGWMMEQAIVRDRVGEVDFLTGDDAYKTDWMSHRRELYGILAMNRGTVTGRVYALREGLLTRLAPLRKLFSRGSLD